VPGFLVAKKGYLCHYDLVNRANLFAVRTNNLGYETATGFEIVGRADAVGKAMQTTLNSMIRGNSCAATVEDNLVGGQEEVCSTVADKMLTGETCSTVVDKMLMGETCSTVADKMLTGETCSTAADKMLTGETATDELLAQSPHGNMFNGISKERLEKLKRMCPFLRLQELFKK